MNESKLRYNEYIKIPGYIAIHNNRIGNTCGGGLITLIREDNKYDKVQKIQVDKHEMIKIDIYFNEKIIHLINCYFPPQIKLKTEILEILSMPNTIFIGDMNAKHTVWGSKKTGSRGRLLEENLEKLNLETYKMDVNHKHFATKKEDVLQIILVHQDRSFKISDIQNLPCVGSDHKPMLVKINKIKNENTKSIKMYHRINKEDASIRPGNMGTGVPP